jgi:hypothetical protein
MVEMTLMLDFFVILSGKFGMFDWAAPKYGLKLAPYLLIFTVVPASILNLSFR